MVKVPGKAPLCLVEHLDATARGILLAAGEQELLRIGRQTPPSGRNDSAVTFTPMARGCQFSSGN